MPWCPKCKTEYKDGVTTCADCNVELVDHLEGNETAYTFLTEVETKDVAERLLNYLNYSGIQDVISEEKENGLYHILVEESDKKEALKHCEIFLQVEEDMKSDKEKTKPTLDELVDSYDQDDSTESDEASFMERSSLKGKKKSKAAYVKREDEYKDLRSTGFMMIGFTIFGYIYIGINLAGILNLLNGVFPYTVLIVMFTAFLYFGISSLIKSKKVFAQIDDEQEITDHINKWLDENFDVNTIDEPAWADYSDELLFFYRTNKLKKMIQKAFGEMDESYLDYVLEEYYNEHIS